MDKTIVVSVERMSRHRLYKRVVRLTTRFKAHDEANEARIGDTVRIEESRPLSATKRWRLVAVVQRAAEGSIEQLVSEEASTSEAIHMAAHPGRETAPETAEVVAASTSGSEPGPPAAQVAEVGSGTPGSVDVADAAQAEASGPINEGEGKS
jgi:small subunit ribosomal protein S17